MRFAEELRARREDAGLSQNQLAKRVGLNSGYVSRLEAGARESPSREAVLALASALELGEPERDRLLAAAGYLPPSLAEIDWADPTLGLVIDILRDQRVPEDERGDFREQIRLAAKRWRPGGRSHQRAAVGEQRSAARS
ncbi:MAG: helix-turn-helix domain-containing protein [Chloroflexi bacterium]|nr:helix-turn-helix domain-containing protein [Chloroflexota bacterium]